MGYSRTHHVDTTYGGWLYPTPNAGGPPEPGKGSAWKLDYHVLNMCLELLEWPPPRLGGPACKA
jgi:mannose/cellobiose epimerase-like protein (N-acyl-D-glucosamine 2-epimerase family)